MRVSAWTPYPVELPHTVTGELLRWSHCPLPPLARSRAVSVWLPPSYHTSARRYPVIYMQDAQNLFDSGTSFSGEEWRVDETMQALSAEGLEAIVVGVDHAGKDRVREYTPFASAWGHGHLYLKALTQSLKPRIDADFRTLPDRANTFIAGSSMGGLISLYAFFMFPLVFGGAGVFSPALWIAHGAIHETVRRTPTLPGRIYLDHGTRESTARPMAQLLREKGYAPGVDLLYVSEKGAHHTESAWARRFPDAVRFLLGAGTTATQNNHGPVHG